jgi:hypothetical protein
VGGLALLILKRGQWKEQYLRIVIEGVAVVVIVEAVLILAMNKSIEADGAVTILSGIAGYLLGRGSGVVSFGGTPPSNTFPGDTLGKPLG